MIGEGIIEAMKQDAFKAAVILAVILGIFTLVGILLPYVESKATPITQEWIDEETVCYYQDQRPINCEKYHPGDHP